MPSDGPDPHAMQPMTVQQRLYVWLAAISATCLIVADIVGIKLFHFPLGFTVRLPFIGEISAIDHTCGMLTFPVTFLLTDLINEYYGKRAARRVTYIGMAMALFVFAVLNIAQAMPYLDAPYNVKKEHFDAIFGSAKVMYLASLTAYLVGQLCDIWFFHMFKRVTGGRLLWLRATGSTVVSQMIDSFVVSYIAFSLGRRLIGDAVPAPMSEVMKIAATGYLLKLVIAIGITPLIYAGHTLIHRTFGLRPLPAEDPRA